MSRIPECFNPVVIKDFAQLHQAVEVAAQRHEEAKGRISDLMRPIFESVPDFTCLDDYAPYEASLPVRDAGQSISLSHYFTFS